MRRIFFLSIALSTFLFGSALAWLCFSDTKAVAVKTITPVPGLEVRTEKPGLLDGIEATSRRDGGGDAQDYESSHGYAQDYVLPDGTAMGEGNICYGSFKEAKSEMMAWLEDAEHIIERVAPSRRRGGAKSERVVASFPDAGFGKRAMIMWVHGPCIHWIDGPGLEHVLEFEKSEFNPHNFEE